MRPGLLAALLSLTWACAPAEAPPAATPGPSTEGAPWVDADGDGLTAEADCNDDDPALGGAEIPYDGLDNDCDPTTLDDDADGDGVRRDDDCDDGNPDAWDEHREWVGAVTGSQQGICTGFCTATVIGDVRMSFPAQYGLDTLGCVTTISGDLEIERDLVENLDALERLQAVGGSVRLVNNDALKQLDSLHAVVIGGDVVVDGSPELESLWGLGGRDRIEGDLVLDDLGVPDLLELSDLDTIGGELVVRSLSVSELTGLEGIRAVEGGAITISQCHEITDLTGFPAAISTVGELDIDNNGALLDLAGLENVTAALDDVRLTYNRDLVSLEGLGLTRIEGKLWLEGNDDLESLRGLGGLTEVEGDVHLRFHPSLTSLGGLHALEVVGGTLKVSDNAALVDLADLSELAVVEGEISVLNNQALIGLGGSSLVEVGSLRVENNALLTNLDGLSALAEVHGQLVVHDNTALLRTDLTTLREVHGELRLDDNVLLENVTGLHGVTRVEGDLILEGNTNLSQAAIDALIAAIDTIGGEVSVD